MAGLIPRRGSLRYRVLGVLAVVVIVPLLFVWLTDIADRTVGERMKVTVSTASSRAERALDGSDPTERLARVAWRYGVRIRVFDETGAVRHDQVAESGNALYKRVADLVFQEDGAPTLLDFDREQPPIPDRADFARALGDGVATGCGATADRKLLVCHAARRVTLPDGTVGIIYAEQSTRRAIRALYDVRYQLLKVSLLGLALAAVLGFWLSRRIVGPIEALREEVLSRVDAPVGAEPISGGKPDEVGDLADAFNALLEAISERAAANEAFVADLAHEIKNPVAAINAAAESLSRGPADAARAERLSRILADSSRRLDALVTELLALARAEAGLPTEIREPMELTGLLHALGEATGARWPAIAIEVTGEPVTVRVVAGRMEMALGNLLENAASFSASRVEVRVSRVGAVARIEVADDGPGIGEEDLPRVFERFFTRRPGDGGTGLGLALAKATVEAHGGHIAATSPGGATFTVSLPIEG